MITRRFFLAGSAAALIAAPAIVRASNLMKILPRRYLPADEVAARLVAELDAWDDSPKGRAQLLWGANPGTQYCRLGGSAAPSMPEEFIDVVKNRILRGYGYV